MLFSGSIIQVAAKAFMGMFLFPGCLLGLYM